ncbi:DUF2877 domain-containing protein [Ereboglobus luteus]|uniref:DUF2877 domain-containing protein n=1 Tax=Ereboglobus luteus TaxID=1796921 RepID=A0A2U8E4K0_9BACT|nr:DUF2877 domain-containing protein [Ereboglobus luteus]AWI09695.1 hypothetical protein CKA38_10930 [Ereboglobus luteus]
MSVMQISRRGAPCVRPDVRPLWGSVRKPFFAHEGARKVRPYKMSRLASESLARASKGRVHSVFTRCFNITTPAGDWLTVALAPFPQTPDSIIVNASGIGADFSPQLCVVAGMPVEISREEISIPDADVVFAFSGAEIFDTRREPFVRSNRAAHNLALAEEIIQRHGRECDFPELQRRITPAIAALREGILRNDAAAIRAQCEALLGLGVGLTPSGDDILCGVTAGLFLGGVTENENQFVPVLRELLPTAGERTTDISVRSLRLCVVGEISGVVFDAARAIMCGEAREVDLAISALLEVGGTSGTEMARGLCLGIQLAEELRG